MSVSWKVMATGLEKMSFGQENEFLVFYYPKSSCHQRTAKERYQNSQRILS